MEKYNPLSNEKKNLKNTTQELDKNFEFKEDLEPEFEYVKIPRDIFTSIEENIRDKNVINESLDKITNGAYLDNRNLNNIMGAYGGMSGSFPGLELSYTIENNYKIWMSAGKNSFLRPDAEMFIFGHENPNFSILMQKMWNYYKEKYFNNNDSAINELVNLLKHTDTQGNVFYKISTADKTFTKTEDVNTFKEFLDVCKKYNLKSEVENRHVVEFLLPYLFLHKMPMDTQHDAGVALSFPRITNIAKDQSTAEKELYSELQKDKELGHYVDYSVSLKGGYVVHYKSK